MFRKSKIGIISMLLVTVLVFTMVPSEAFAKGESTRSSSWRPARVHIADYDSDFGKVKLIIDKMYEKYPLTYQVKYWKPGSSETHIRTFKDVKTSMVIDGLTLSGKYNFQVRAYYYRNDRIYGSWSNQLTCYANTYGNRSRDPIRGKFYVTDPGEPGKTDIDIKVGKAPFKNTPKNLRYQVAYKIKGDSDYHYSTGTSVYRDLHNLERGVTYQIKTRFYYTSPIDGKRTYSYYSDIKYVRLALPVKDILNVARSWIGKNEADGSYKSIIDVYNSHEPLAGGHRLRYSEGWCTATVSAMFIKVNGTRFAGGTECNVQRYIDLFKKHGVWEEDGRITPEPGDIICYNWDDRTQPNTGWADHVGIVEKVSNGKITAIEGNYRDCVARRTISVKSGTIRGYAVFSYPETSRVW